MTDEAGVMIPGEERHIPLLGIPPEDNEDMLRGWGVPSLAMLRRAYEESEEVWTLLAGERVVGMWGCTSEGNVWMIRGVGLERIAVRFIRRSRQEFDRLQARHGELFCAVNQRYDKLIRLLKWCGFSVTPINEVYVRCSRCAD